MSACGRCRERVTSKAIPELYLKEKMEQRKDSPNLMQKKNQDLLKEWKAAPPTGPNGNTSWGAIGKFAEEIVLVGLVIGRVYLPKLERQNTRHIHKKNNYPKSYRNFKVPTGNSWIWSYNYMNLILFQ